MSIKSIVALNGLLLLASLFVFIVAPNPAMASEVKFTPQVPLPGQQAVIDFTDVKDTRPIAEYIKLFFKYLTGVAGILATVFMMVGGVIWLTAAGSPDKISTAKSYVTSSITGLLLAFGAYILLSTINTDLVNLRTTSIAQIKKAPTSTDLSTSVINGCQKINDSATCNADSNCTWLTTICMPKGVSANCSYYNAPSVCNLQNQCKWNAASLKCENNSIAQVKCGVTKEEYQAFSTGLDCCKSTSGEFKYARIDLNNSKSCTSLCGANWQSYGQLAAPNCRSVLGYGP